MWLQQSKNENKYISDPVGLKFYLRRKEVRERERERGEMKMTEWLSALAVQRVTIG